MFKKYIFYIFLSCFVNNFKKADKSSTTTN